jgi:hypothetical protein
MIGIILLIGLVKKNAIMMIDFALAAERNEGKNSRDSIFEACLLRFRPIMMTTMAAMLGALPLALGHGHGVGVAAPPGNYNYRRSDCEPDADAVHHSRWSICTSTAATLLDARAGAPARKTHSGREQKHGAGSMTRSCGAIVHRCKQVAQMWGRTASCGRLVIGHCHEPVFRPRPALSSRPITNRPLCRSSAPVLFLAGLRRRPQLQASRGHRSPRIQRAAARGVQGSAGGRIAAGQPLRRLPKRQMVGDLQRSRSERARRASRHQQSKRAGGGSELPPGQGAVRVARAGLFPTVTVGPSISEAHAVTTQGSSSTYSLYTLPLDASWEPDLWGNIRRGVTASAATAQASFADLENAKLLYQSELASDYFQLHGIDGDIDLLNTTAKSYDGISHPHQEPLCGRRSVRSGRGAGGSAALRNTVAIDRSGRAAGAV